MSYEAVRGDTSRPMQVTITDDDGELDLDGATAEMRWVRPDDSFATVAVLLEEAEDDGTSAVFRRNWASGDLDIVGAHRGQLVTTKGPNVRTFPNDGAFFYWFVNPRLGD